MTRSRLVPLLRGLAALGPACTTTYRHGPVAYRHAMTAFDEGYRRGLSDGQWAGRHDHGRPYRQSFWDDARYRRGDYGYRLEYGPRGEFSDGYRTGYEGGDRDIREHDYRD